MDLGRSDSGPAANNPARWYDRLRNRRWRIYRGEADGVTVYFGQRRGARYIGVDLRGFSGWSSSRWLPGGWEFFNPTLSTGRLFMDASRSWSREVHIPAKVWDFYYWRVRPSGRRFRRDAQSQHEPVSSENLSDREQASLRKMK